MVRGDVFFEEINKNSQMNRKLFVHTKQKIGPLEVSKYIKFKVKDRYTCREIYSLAKMLEQKNRILLSFFNPMERECCFIFVGSYEDYELEEFLEMKNL